MADASGVEERLRRLEESHEALARRMKEMDTPGGALKMLEKAEGRRSVLQLTFFGVVILLLVVWHFLR